LDVKVAVAVEEKVDVLVVGGVVLTSVLEVEVLVAGGAELGVVNVVVQEGKIKTAKNAIIAILYLGFIKYFSPTFPAISRNPNDTLRCHSVRNIY
jgi:hypothetical protein